ncbi:MAG: M23 family metallopeptidase [Steroidobacteraceae bacterium]
MSKIAVLVILVIASIDVAKAEDPQPFIVHGIRHDCQEILQLERALRPRWEPYFYSWSAADYEAAIQWVTACAVGDSGRNVVAMLRDREKKVVEKAKQRKEDEAKEKRYENCKQSSDFALFQIQERIIIDVERKSDAQRQIEREQKIAAVSGTEDLEKKYRAGQTIVSVDEDIESNWPKYKTLGGSSESPDSVRHTVPNPCRRTGLDVAPLTQSRSANGNEGLDLDVPEGTALIAVAAGLVSWTGERAGHGLMVEIDHGNGVTSRFNHIAKVLVKQGDLVRKWQQIAIAGPIVHSEGSHPRFEVLKNGVEVDPLHFVDEDH